jgi:hypothetical protein
MNRKTHQVGAIVALAALITPTALAQNDECAGALPLPVGTVAFDTAVATLSAEVWPCASGGGPDLWYTYTATANSTLTISTCGSTYDTALEVFEGGCGALVPLDCNDDSCALQSSISFAAASGATYFVRVGGFSGASGSGTLALDDGSPRLNPVNGNFYLGVSAPGISWDQARADAAAMSHMGIQGRLVTLNDAQENDFVFALGNVNNYWLGGFHNTSSPSYSEPDGGWEWITGEAFTYTNWLVGEPNNSGAFGAEDYLELLQSTGFGETWNDAAQMEHPAGYVVEFSSDGLGVSYCSTNPNSQGTEGRMSATGSLAVANNDLTVTASDITSLVFGFFIVSRTEGFVMNPAGSAGNLCLGGAIGRYVGPGQIQNSGLAAEISLPIDLTLIPQPLGFEAVAPGDTWSFQLWHRDSDSGGNPTSNFTDGLRLTFS